MKKHLQYQHIYRYLLKSGNLYRVCGRNAKITSASVASEYSSESRGEVKRAVLVRLMAELDSGKSRDRAGYGRREGVVWS